MAEKEELKKLVKEVLRMSSAELERYHEERSRVRKRGLDSIMRKACGATFDEKFKNPDDVLKGLSADDAATRNLALYALLGPWERAAGGICAFRVEEMALSDPDVVVRANALAVLGTLFQGTRERRIGLLLGMTQE
jgi:glycogen debranching enzyme